MLLLSESDSVHASVPVRDRAGLTTAPGVQPLPHDGTAPPTGHQRPRRSKTRKSEREREPVVVLIILNCAQILTLIEISTEIIKLLTGLHFVHLNVNFYLKSR